MIGTLPMALGDIVNIQLVRLDYPRRKSLIFVVDAPSINSMTYHEVGRCGDEIIVVGSLGPFKNCCTAVANSTDECNYTLIDGSRLTISHPVNHRLYLSGDQVRVDVVCSGYPGNIHALYLSEQDFFREVDRFGLDWTIRDGKPSPATLRPHLHSTEVGITPYDTWSAFLVWEHDDYGALERVCLGNYWPSEEEANRAIDRWVAGDKTVGCFTRKRLISQYPDYSVFRRLDLMAK